MVMPEDSRMYVVARTTMAQLRRCGTIVTLSALCGLRSFQRNQPLANWHAGCCMWQHVIE